MADVRDPMALRWPHNGLRQLGERLVDADMSAEQLLDIARNKSGKEGRKRRYVAARLVGFRPTEESWNDDKTMDFAKLAAIIDGVEEDISL